MIKRSWMVLFLLFASLRYAPPAFGQGLEIEKDIPGLAAVYQSRFRIGTCVETTQLQGAEAELVRKHFSSLTAENVMKPERIAPKNGVFRFDAADAIVDFALQNKLAVRGHTLVWHLQTAPWMFKDDAGGPVSKAELIRRMEQHIKTVVGRYRGKVYAWDVVNEPVEQNGLRRSPWLDIIGEEYIELALRFAREADPQAKLFINEIETENNRLKLEALYRLVKQLKDKKTPIDGVGLQFHIALDAPSLESMAWSLKRIGELGLEIHVTELDMTVNGDPKLKAERADENVLVRQAHRYRELFELFKAAPLVTNVTFWGFQDGHTWLTYSPVVKADWPLLFDRNLKAKLAFWGLVDPARLPKDVTLTKGGNNKIGAAKRGTPVIDGVEDAVWKKAQPLPIALYIQGQGATGEGRVLWDKKNLYVLVKVKDNNLSKKSPNSYEQDSIEIFVDEKNNKSTEYLEDDAQYRINFTNDFSSRGTPAKIKSVPKTTADGYLIEVMIPFQSIKAAPGVRLGFDLQINDDPGSGKRESYSKWNDPTNESFRNTAGFGTLVLE